MATEKKFACVAEAVAHYANRGYKTTSEDKTERFMQKGARLAVRIRYVGFMDIRARELEARYADNSWVPAN